MDCLFSKGPPCITVNAQILAAAIIVVVLELCGRTDEGTASLDVSDE